MALEAMKITLSKNELILKFKQQISSIEALCKLFDEGNYDIANDIAVKIRVLFHSTNRSKSLINQLKIKDLKMIDTASKFSANNRAAHYGLLMVKFVVGSTDKSEFQPTCYIPDMNEIGEANIDNWWKGKKVIKDGDGSIFHRKDIILEVANTDGGAHVDPKIKEEYYKLSRSENLGYSKVDKSGIELKFNNPVLPCIRQIAHEIIESFKDKDIESISKLYK